MNNLIQNYEKILDVINKTCSHIPSQYQIREPKLSDRELVALNLRRNTCLLILNYSYLEHCLVHY